MALALILFWVIVVWGLVDGEIYAKEGAIYIAIWAVLLAGTLFFPSVMIGCLVGLIGLDIYLLFKVFGGNIPTRP